ncbi:MAG TPA: hypothetical protein PLZ57_05415 [Pseudobdellovibrionaceae bacterium]|nr:hypothetical protein [Pseudobdellovibrionaceae bacterium]
MNQRDGGSSSGSGKSGDAKSQAGSSSGASGGSHERGEVWDDPVTSSAGPRVGDSLKKLLATGISAAFMTEESLRRFVSDMKLPKETLDLLLQGASKSKDDLMNRVTREVIGIISKIDFVKEASKFAEEHKFRVVAEIEVIKKQPGSTSEASSVTVETERKSTSS